MQVWEESIDFEGVLGSFIDDPLELHVCDSSPNKQSYGQAVFDLGFLAEHSHRVCVVDLIGQEAFLAPILAFCSAPVLGWLKLTVLP